MPRTSPFFDGTRIALVAARGETIGIQVLHRGGGPAALQIQGARVQGYDVARAQVVRPSTAMYGGSRGKGAYPDGLTPAATPSTDPGFFEITAEASGEGELVVAGRHIPVSVAVADVTLPPPPIYAWAYYDPRELGGTVDAPNDAERACIAMFRKRGVLLSPDLPPAAWSARKELLAGSPIVPAVIGTEPAEAREDVRAWIEATRGSHQIPFAIPIDEPRSPDARKHVRALADAAREAGGGEGKFLYAVTDAPRDEYANAVDLYISLTARRDDGFTRWTYNGAPPRAGSMVLDAAAPGMRTWGWIGWRWHIPIWYVWDALYWHDRHNKKGALDVARDAVSFDDGDDHGNLDGVLVLPGCQPTLRLAALRRGLQDRALLELAAKCAPDATAKLAERLVPRALGDADAHVAWPTDEAAWESARRELLELASCARSGSAQ